MADPMIAQALADLRASVARLEAALDSTAAPAAPAAPAPPTAPPQPQQGRAVLAFQALQARLAGMTHWPGVTSTPWLSSDAADAAQLGRHIGDDYRAGLAELSFELERDAAPWLQGATLGGTGISLGVLLEALPGLLALLADERVGALLARDGWMIPPVLLPILAQVGRNQEG